MKNIDKNNIIILAILLLMAFSCFACSHNSHRDTILQKMTLTVSSSFFRPAMEFSESALVILDYDDGTAPITVNVEKGVYLFDRYNFVDTLDVHKVEILVSPWSALTVLNLGFRGGDGGNGGSEIKMSGLPFIQFHPTFEAVPFQSSVDESNVVHDFAGTVTAIDGLSTAYNLIALCCEFQPIQKLDLSNCRNVLALEGYYSDIKSTNFQGCVSLRRCCLESTGAHLNWRIVNGERIENEVLDLRDCPDLRDIRGSGNDHTMLYLHPDAMNTLWHLCKMGNARMQTLKIGDENPQKLDVSRFTNLVQCWIAGSPVITSLAITNNKTNSVVADSCGISSIDLHDQKQMVALGASDNHITSINIDGCTGLNQLHLNNCGLTQTHVDYILGILVELNGTDGELDLGGDSNSAPSSSGGLPSAQILNDRGWKVTCRE